MVEETSAALQLDQEIDIAFGAGLTPRDGAKDPDIGGAMPGGDAEDVLPSFPQKLLDSHHPLQLETRAKAFAKGSALYDSGAEGAVPRSTSGGRATSPGAALASWRRPSSCRRFSFWALTTRRKTLAVSWSTSRIILG